MESLFEFNPLILAIVPVIVGVVGIFKGLGLSGRFAPLLAVIVGILLVTITGITWPASVIQGLIAGLAASGLYSGTKATVGN